MGKQSRQRADLLVHEQGLAESRNKAQAMILAGQVVTENGDRVEKAGQLWPAGTAMRIRGKPLPFVSRGGLKLQGALQAFDVDPTDQVALDVGASTGGFTDCLLQHGARRIYAVDVGYGQMHWRVRQDERVVVIERTNIRHMEADRVPEPCSLMVVDVSFISLRLVVPACLPFLSPGATLLALVKPQFEVGRESVGRGGIVRDDSARLGAVKAVAEALAGLGFADIRWVDSPIQGAKGNHEFLLHARRQSSTDV